MSATMPIPGADSTPDAASHVHPVRESDETVTISAFPVSRSTTLREPLTYSCGGCENRWIGVSRCHCSGCHRTFNAEGPFARHRRERDGDGYCVDPETITNTDGARVMFLTDGIWSASPNLASRAARLRKPEPS